MAEAPATKLMMALKKDPSQAVKINLAKVKDKSGQEKKVQFAELLKGADKKNKNNFLPSTFKKGDSKNMPGDLKTEKLQMPSKSVGANPKTEKVEDNLFTFPTKKVEVSKDKTSAKDLTPAKDKTDNKKPLVIAPNSMENAHSADIPKDSAKAKKTEKLSSDDAPETRLRAENPVVNHVLPRLEPVQSNESPKRKDKPSLPSPKIRLADRLEIVDKRENQVSDTKEQVKVAAKIFRVEKPLRKSSKAEPLTIQGDAKTLVGDTKFAVSETEISLPNETRVKGADVAAELARKLDAQEGNEIVRQVKIILNRADAGEVRINLRPENLGSVRVRIRMEENRLSGRIFVESAAARDAFRSALDGLQAKLVESGFGAADLELAWDEHNTADSQHQKQARRQMNNQSDVVGEFENMASKVLDESIAEGKINMVV